MLAREVSSRAYPEIGVPDSHPRCRINSTSPREAERMHRVNEMHFQQFAHSPSRLAALPEGEGRCSITRSSCTAPGSATQ